MVYDICEFTERCSRRSNVSGGVEFGLVTMFPFLLSSICSECYLHRRGNTKSLWIQRMHSALIACKIPKSALDPVAHLLELTDLI